MLITICIRSFLGQKVDSKAGWSDRDIDDFVDKLQPSIDANNIGTVDGRTAISKDMARVTINVKGSRHWNVLICSTDQCTWNFPYCQNNFLILVYSDYYLQIFDCGN